MDRYEIEFASIVSHQLHSFFNYTLDVSPYIPPAYQHSTDIFCRSANKYFQSGTTSPFHSVQYCIFLYWLSHVMAEKDGNGQNAEKIYYLNKIINSVDLFYEVKLPRIWACEHPLGSIMGRATYSDNFFFYQGCTVGGNNGYYPNIGFNVTMYSNSKILGRCNIGNHVIIGANAYVKNTDIPDNCIVFGQTPNLTIKQRSCEEIQAMTSHIWKTP